MERLAGKVCLVTGGGSGIGLAIAQAFLDEGAKVAICGRQANRLREAAGKLTPSSRLFWQAADITDPHKVADLLRAVTAELGSVDILVNNAGVNVKNRGMRELTPVSWQYLVRANLDGAFHCIHAVLPGMLERRDGLIINICSTSGKRSSPLGGAAYNAAKFGMSALGICLAAEERDSGIRVSNIFPGETDTPILEDRPQPVSKEQRQKILRPEDVAAAALFVATLPAHVSIPELIIKPTTQLYV